MSFKDYVNEASKEGKYAYITGKSIKIGDQEYYISIHISDIGPGEDGKIGEILIGTEKDGSSYKMNHPIYNKKLAKEFGLINWLENKYGSIKNAPKNSNEIYRKEMKSAILKEIEKAVNKIKIK